MAEQKGFHKTQKKTNRHTKDIVQRLQKRVNDPYFLDACRGYPDSFIAFAKWCEIKQNIPTSERNKTLSSFYWGPEDDDEIERDSDWLMRKISVFNRFLNPICRHCSDSKGTTDLRRCTGCNLEWYCSSDCQSKDWERHAPQCKNKSRDMPLDVTSPHLPVFVPIKKDSNGKNITDMDKYFSPISLAKEYIREMLNK